MNGLTIDTENIELNPLEINHPFNTDQTNNIDYGAQNTTYFQNNPKGMLHRVTCQCNITSKRRRTISMQPLDASPLVHRCFIVVNLLS